LIITLHVSAHKLSLSTTVYAEAYTYTNDTTMVDNGDTNGLKAKNCAYKLH